MAQAPASWCSPIPSSSLNAPPSPIEAPQLLPELRRAFSLTQDTLARTLNVKQAEISKIENRADMLMSTLRNFVQAMGGDLEVRAVFPDRAIEISTFSSLAGKPAKIRTGKKQQQVLAEA